MNLCALDATWTRRLFLSMEAALEALRALRLAEPGIGVKPLVAKLKEQRLDLEVGAKEVREMVRKLDEEHGGVLGDAAVAMQAAMVSMIKDSRKWSVLQWASFVVYGLPAFEVHSSGVAAALDAESAVPGGLTSMNGGLPSEDAPQEPFLLDEHGDPCWVVAQEQQQLRALKHQRPTRWYGPTVQRSRLGRGRGQPAQRQIQSAAGQVLCLQHQPAARVLDPVQGRRGQALPGAAHPLSEASGRRSRPHAAVSPRHERQRALLPWRQRAGAIQPVHEALH